LYIKDWHFVLDFPDYHGYECPSFFRDDWLNAFHDHQRQCKDLEMADPLARTAAQLTVSESAAAFAGAGADDMDTDDNPGQAGRQGYDGYRFVYMGPRGSSTAVHADVFRSFSWSINLAGRKKWRFLAPEHSSLLLDKWVAASLFIVLTNAIVVGSASRKRGHLNSGLTWKSMRQTFSQDFSKPELSWYLFLHVFLVFLNSYARTFRGRWSWTRALVMQCLCRLDGCMKFAVSVVGWYFVVDVGARVQVINEEDTLSVNHNWINFANIAWTVQLVLDSYQEAKGSVGF
jgi:hypothetical protein